MPLRLLCTEPDALPPRVTLDLEPSETASLYLLTRPAPGNLRSLVLRPRDADRPPDSVRVADIDVSRTGAGGAVGRLRAISPAVDLMVLRGEVRARAQSDVDLRGVARLELTWTDGRAIAFALEVTAQQRHGARQSAGSGRSSTMSAQSRELRTVWIIPRLWEAMQDPATRAADAMRRVTPSWVRSRTFMVVVTVLCLVAAGILLGARQRAHAREADEAVATARVEVEVAEANLNAALSSEQSCVAVRQSQARRLDDQIALDRARMEAALDLSHAREQAISLGGPTARTPDALAWDAALRGPLVEAALRALDELRLSPAPSTEPCLAQAAALGTDLPRYALLWHAQEGQVCTADYALVLNGVDRAGRWGLSARLATAHGLPVDEAPMTLLPDLTEAPPDMRYNDPWSAAALASALRDAQSALLRGARDNRPAVAPSQLQLWALALLTAWDASSSPTAGALDASLSTCVAEVLDRLEASGGAASPGQPVLPDLAAAARGETPELQATAACPWPPGALTDGARAALRAAARVALVEDP